MNFGQRGRDLVAECANHSDLLPYNDESVKACLEEITFHVDELTHIIDAIENEKPSLEVRPALMLHDAAIRRNKRCLLAYVNHRVNYIKENHAANPTAFQAKALLSEAESDFAQAYERLRAQQSDAVGGTLDLGRRPKLPPTQTFLQVRVLQSLGKIVLTETGATVNLEKGTLHFLPAQDVEEFIQQGFLEQVEGEEAF
jgi:GINS complex subunit 1